MAERILIIGGVAAGTSAAAKAKRLRPDLDIVIYQREAFVSYSACGLPYFIAGAVADHHALVARTPEQFAKQGITVKTEHEVEAIDAAAGRLTIRELGSGSVFHDHYDHLILATGARVLVPPTPGLDLPGVFRLRSMADGLAIKQYLAEHKPQSAVVVGAGYIGVEMAEAFLDLEMQVTLMDMAPNVLRTLDPEMAQMVEAAMVEAGVTLRLGAKMEAVNSRPDGRVCCIDTDGAMVSSDIVLLATGVRPNSELAVAAGVRCGPRNAIEVDGLGRTNVERIYGAGDCCTIFNRALQLPAYLPLGTNANKQGRTLGAFLGGVERPLPGVVGTAATKFRDLHIASTGLSERDAQLAGLQTDCTLIESTDHAGYYPGARPLHVKMVVERGTRRVLGAQIIGYDDVAKRADIVALAVAQGLTVDELAWSDLSYAPPFSSVWDPVLVAAQKLASR